MARCWWWGTQGTTSKNLKRWRAEAKALWLKKQAVRITVPVLEARDARTRAKPPAALLASRAVASVAPGRRPRLAAVRWVASTRHAALSHSRRAPAGGWLSPPLACLHRIGGGDERSTEAVRGRAGQGGAGPAGGGWVRGLMRLDRNLYVGKGHHEGRRCVRFLHARRSAGRWVETSRE